LSTEYGAVYCLLPGEHPAKEVVVRRMEKGRIRRRCLRRKKMGGKGGGKKGYGGEGTGGTAWGFTASKSGVHPVTPKISQLLNKKVPVIGCEARRKSSRRGGVTVARNGQSKKKRCAKNRKPEALGTKVRRWGYYAAVPGGGEPDLKTTGAFKRVGEVRDHLCWD